MKEPHLVNNPVSVVSLVLDAGRDIPMVHEPHCNFVTGKARFRTIQGEVGILGASGLFPGDMLEPDRQTLEPREKIPEWLFPEGRRTVEMGKIKTYSMAASLV